VEIFQSDSLDGGFQGHLAGLEGKIPGGDWEVIVIKMRMKGREICS
jgi:hypothetical protein